MTTPVFLAVLCAALLHASWNALLKSGADKTLAMGAVILGHVPIALVLIPFVPLPSPESLPYLAAGVALHFGYQIFLLNSYRLGDLTQVYPIARGIAPLIVALVSVGLLGVVMSGPEKLAIAVIAVGIMSLSLVRRSDGERNLVAVVLALGTGGFIAGYSLVDGLGARLAGTALGYYAWLSIFNGAAMVGYLAWRAPGTLSAIPRCGKLSFFMGGCASFLAYAIVIWAFTQAPIALVTALRETSIVFALLIGVFFLRERLDLLKVFSTAATLTGAILLRFAR
ncbi:MAG: DMT family transporter [Pseudomonadota bacterium]